MWAVILRSKMPTRGRSPRNGVQAPACRRDLVAHFPYKFALGGEGSPFYGFVVSNLFCEYSKLVNYT